MKRRQQLLTALSAAALAMGTVISAAGQVVQDPPFGRPHAVIDLASREGVQLVKGQWRYHEVKIVDADSRAVGRDLKPSGDPIKTYDYAPHAGAANYDDSQWERIEPTTLDQRRSTGKYASTGIASTSRTRRCPSRGIRSLSRPVDDQPAREPPRCPYGEERPAHGVSGPL